METENAPPKQAEGEIAETGDLILVVGPDKVKLRVHSIILKVTSKPFAAMLGPHWKEGSSLPSSESPVEIHLPTDNAVSLAYICRLIHYHPYEEPSPSEILDIAVTADKWDFISCLDHTIKCRFRKVDFLDYEGDAIMHLLVAAYIFRDKRWFWDVTHEMILEVPFSFHMLYQPERHSMIDWCIVQRLEEKRAWKRLQLSATLAKLIEECICISCDTDSLPSGELSSYFTKLREIDLWPIRTDNDDLELGIEIDTATRMPSSFLSFLLTRPVGDHLEKLAPIFRRHRQTMESFEADIGVCFDCYQLGYMDPATQCRGH